MLNNIFSTCNVAAAGLGTVSYHMVAQGDTEKYLTRENLYHPRHTCITCNTGVSRVIQVFKGPIISPYHPGNHAVKTLSHRRNLCFNSDDHHSCFGMFLNITAVQF